MNLTDLKSIEALFSEFAWCADRGLGTAMAQLFAEDGVLAVGGKEAKGRQLIGEVCQQRAQPPRRTRHSWSSLRIVEFEQNIATTTSIQTTFELADEQSPGLVRVSDLNDWLVKTAEGEWRFQRREIIRQISVG